MTHVRNEGALLAGVCAAVAGRLGWNVWALRILFVLFLLVKATWAIVAYAVAALALHLIEGRASERRPADGLASPELSDRAGRIADLERRFRELEGKDPR